MTPPMCALPTCNGLYGRVLQYEDTPPPPPDTPRTPIFLCMRWRIGIRLPFPVPFHPPHEARLTGFGNRVVTWCSAGGLTLKA